MNNPDTESNGLCSDFRNFFLNKTQPLNTETIRLAGFDY